jgi:hypothetical protein
MQVSGHQYTPLFTSDVTSHMPVALGLHVCNQEPQQDLWWLCLMRKIFCLWLQNSSDPRTLVLSICSAMSIKHPLLKSLTIISVGAWFSWLAFLLGTLTALLLLCRLMMTSVCIQGFQAWTATCNFLSLTHGVDTLLGTLPQLGLHMCCDKGLPSTVWG